MRVALTFVVVCSLAAASGSAAQSSAVGRPKLGVVPIAGEPDRGALVAALEQRGTFDIQPVDYVDRVLADLAASGVTCTGGDDGCWLRFAVNAGIDIVVVGSVQERDGGRVLSLEALDARGGPKRSAARPVTSSADVAAVVSDLFAAPPRAPVATAAPPSRSPPSRSPPSPSPPPAPPLDRAIPVGSAVVAGAFGLVAAGCGTVTAIDEVNAWHAIARWDAKQTIDGAAEKRADIAELGFGVCTAAAISLGIGAGVVAAVTWE